MPARAHQPNPERLSNLLATLLLTLVLAQFIQLPEQLLPLQFAGIFIPIRLNTNTVVGGISAGLMAAGADWMMRDHPARGNHSTVPHLVLPALVTWILSVALNNLEPGLLWWLAFAGAGLLLWAVLVAEYTVLDTQDLRNPFANAMLVALAYAAFAILSITLHSTNFRLLFLLPGLGLAAGLVFLRVSNILLGSGWHWLEALAASLIVLQLAAPLNYFRISSLAYGTITLAALYAFTAFATALKLGRPVRRAFFEPGLALLAALLLTLTVLNTR